MITTLHGDCREQLQTIAAGSVQCVVTSPPYYGLRKYSDDPREIGQEAQPDCLAWARREPPCGACYVCALREVFAQVWRVLRDDGVIFLNLGDSYAANRPGGQPAPTNTGNRKGYIESDTQGIMRVPDGLKSKDLLGIPWRVAFALQADGYYLRNDNIWAKPNCMPESVTDRCTRSHEYVFLLAKSARYFYDAAAIAEPIQQSSIDRINQPSFDQQTGGPKDYGTTGVNTNRSMRKTLENFKTSAASGTRNKRTVWSIPTQSYSGAHYATMPEALIAPCILAGSSAQACETCGAAWGRVVEKQRSGESIVNAPNGQHLDTLPHGLKHDPTRRLGPNIQDKVIDLGFAPRCTCAVNTGSARSVVLDMFGGSGTVGRVATRYQRDAVLIELNADYIADHIETRTDGVQVELFV